MQRKWKSLRDSYTRELSRKQKEPSGSAAQNRKQYVFFEQLRFLETAVKITSSSLDHDDNQINKNISPAQEQESDQQRNMSTSEARSVKGKRPRTSHDTPTEDEVFLQHLKKRYMSATQDSSDPDTLFMLSLVPELKKLTGLQKLAVKSDIINLICKRQQEQNTIPFPPATPHASTLLAYQQQLPAHSFHLSEALPGPFVSQHQNIPGSSSAPAVTYYDMQPVKPHMGRNAFVERNTRNTDILLATPAISPSYSDVLSPHDSTSTVLSTDIDFGEDVNNE